MLERLNEISPMLEALGMFVVFAAALGILISMHLKKNQQEKQEALQVTVLLSVAILIVNAFFDIFKVFVGSEELVGAHASIDMLLFAVAVYAVYYTYLTNANASKKSAYRTKVYTDLEDLEAWLNKKGQEGYRCKHAIPELYLFKLGKKAGKRCFYKAEYVEAKKSGEFDAYVKENEEKGWELLNRKNDIGSVTIAVFSTIDEKAAEEPANHQKPASMQNKLSATIIWNVIISAVCIGLNIFLFPNEPALQFLTFIILGITMLQIGLSFHFSMSQKAEAK